MVRGRRDRRPRRLASGLRGVESVGSLATWATLCLRQLGRHWAAASGLVASTLSCHGLPWPPAALGIQLQDPWLGGAQQLRKRSTILGADSTSLPLGSMQCRMRPVLKPLPIWADTVFSLLSPTGSFEAVAASCESFRIKVITRARHASFYCRRHHAAIRHNQLLDRGDVWTNSEQLQNHRHAWLLVLSSRSTSHAFASSRVRMAC